MIKSLIISLILTLIIEIPVAIMVGIRTKNDIEIVFWVNVLTNPVVVFAANIIYLLNNNILYYCMVYIMEILVVIIEGKIFKEFLNFKEKNPYLISFINNFTSYMLGVIIVKFIN